MKISVVAIGRMKRGPESELLLRYADRLAKSGRAIGLEWAGIREFPESRSGLPGSRMSEEASTVLAGLSPDDVLVALDERGQTVSSEAFAQSVGAKRDGGTRSIVFAIGGPDGHGDEVRERATELIALGRMTWPHQIARVLLLEQLYRATTILSGHPYHRS